MSVRERIRELEMKDKKTRVEPLLNDYKYENLNKILREAYKHPELSWIDVLFNELREKISKFNVNKLTLDPKKLGCDQIINLYFPKVNFEVEDLNGFGDESIQGGIWDENKEIPVCQITKDFLKNFRKNSSLDFNDCKNAFRSFIAHELSHESQNKVVNEETGDRVFDVTPYYEGKDNQKYMMQPCEFDAHSREVAQALLDIGLEKKEAIIKLQVPSELKRIQDQLRDRNLKAHIILGEFMRRKKDRNTWQKFIRKIYDYYYDDLNEETY